jgi:acylphosphatase
MIVEPAGSPEPVMRLRAVVRGRVQGVGFRWWTRSRALELGLVGSAVNLPDGRVEVIAYGPQQACRRLLELLSSQPAPPVPVDAPRSYYRRPGRVLSVSSDLQEVFEGQALPVGFVER